MRRSWSRACSIAAIAAAGASILSLGACGGAETSRRTTAQASSHHPSQPFLGDGDFDHGDGDADNSWDTDSDAPFDYYSPRNESWNRGIFHDRDDAEKLAFGRPADAADARAISLVVRRYYAFAARDEGSRACAMLLPSVARIAADYRQNGIPYLRGVTTCPTALHRVFRHDRLSVPDLTSVRVARDTALVLWGSRTMPAGYMTLVRRGLTWAITAPVGSSLL